jgi:hypothetical protein
MCADLDAAHAAPRGEGNEVGAQLGEIAAANAVPLLGEHDDGAALGGLVGERGELRGIGQLLLGTPRSGLNSVAWRRRPRPRPRGPTSPAR